MSVCMNVAQSIPSQMNIDVVNFSFDAFLWIVSGRYFLIQFVEMARA